MKTFIFTSLVFLFSLSGYCQTTPPSAAVMEVDYFKVKDENITAYLASEKDWHKVHEVRIKEKKVAAWMLFEVILPNGSQVDHNYVTVTFLNSYADLETVVPDMIAAMGKAFPTQNAAEKFAQSMSLRTRVKSEIVYNTFSHWKDNAPGLPFQYVNASFVKVDEGKEASFENQFNGYWKGVMTALVDLGYRQNFLVGERSRSHGTNDAYDYEVFESFKGFLNKRTLKRMVVVLC